MHLLTLPTALALLSPFLVLPASALYDDPVDPNAKGGYFLYGDVVTGFVAALNAVEDGDLYLHMSAPASHSWMGLGIGSSMAPHTFMLVSHAAHNGTSVITSPRLATGHHEPTLLHDVTIEYVYTDQYAPNANTRAAAGLMIAHILCRNCSAQAGLDFRNKAQEFIFALGPDGKLANDDPGVGLKRHDFFGHFTMDMTAATTAGTQGRVPAPNLWNQAAVAADSTFTTSNASPAYATKRDSDLAALAHGICMCLAFAVIFPLGAVLLRGLRSAVTHAVLQSLGLVLVLIGGGLGVVTGLQYNVTSHFNAPHQVLGLLLVASLLIQFALGIFTHRQHLKRKAQPQLSTRSPLAYMHLTLGPLTMLFGLINGGLGLALAGKTQYNVAYGVVVAVLGLLFGGIRLWQFLRQRVRVVGTYEPEIVDPEEYFAKLAQQGGWNGGVGEGGDGRGMYMPTPTRDAFAQHHAEGAGEGWEMKEASGGAWPLPATHEGGEVLAGKPTLTLQTH